LVAASLELPRERLGAVALLSTGTLVEQSIEFGHQLVSRWAHQCGVVLDLLEEHRQVVGG
jgi:hypothetical protein